jgi:hypothetical protein
MIPRRILIEDLPGGVMVSITKEGVLPLTRKMELTLDQLVAQTPFLQGIMEVAAKEWEDLGATSRIDPPIGGLWAGNCPKCGAFEATCDGKTIKCLNCGHEATGVSWPQVPAHFPKTVDEAIHEIHTELGKPDLRTSVTAANTEEAVAQLNAKADANQKVLEHAVATETPIKITLETPAPPKTRVSAKSLQYRLKGDPPSGTLARTFDNIQAALDALGVDKANRPLHNRYARLSKKLQAEIIEEVKP